MGAGYKFDHAPLLAPGRHYMDLMGVKRMCLDPFPGSPTRRSLYYAFEELLQRFLVEKIPCEFWVDGSFLTQKIDPQDVDVAIKIDHDVTSSLTASQRLLVDDANEAEFIKGIDSYVFVALPRHHEHFGTALDERETWAEQFGLEHSERWCKGLAVLRLGETSVGLRIRR